MIVHLAFILIYVLAALVFSSTVLSACTILHTIFILRRYWGGRKKLDLLCTYAVYVAMSCVTNILTILKVQNGTLERFYEYIKPDKIDSSVLLWSIGNTFLFIGFELIGSRKIASIRLEMRKTNLHQAMFVIMMALMFRRIFIDDMVLGSLAIILSVISLMGIVFFARLWATINSTVYRNYAILLFVAQTIYNLMYAYLRQNIIMPAVCLFVGYFILGEQPLRRYFSYRMLPFVFVGLVFFTYFDTFGEFRGGALGSGLDRISNLQALSAKETIYMEDESEEQSVFSRASVLPQLSNIIDLVENRGYYNGDVSAILIVALIPRFLWPEKPLIGLGAWFAAEIGQAIENGTWYNNSINMTIPGQIFLDFGWVGLVLGCTLVGAYLGLLWNSTEFHLSPYNITGIIFGGYLLITALTGMGADLQILINLTSYFLIFLLLKRFLT